MSTYDPKYAKKWRIERARGHKRTIPAIKAQRHVQTLTIGGASIRAIADVSGTAPSTISQLDRGIKKSLTHASEAAILGVQLEQIFNRTNADGFVPNEGARRRIRALLAMGWRHQDISAAIGSQSANAIHQIGAWISRTKHDRIVAAYDEMWDKRGPSEKTARWAAKLGYLPPLAWDEDTIDDPNAEPADLTPRPVCGSKWDDRAEDLEFLLNAGTGLHEIEQRLSLPFEQLQVSMRDADRMDLVDRLRTLNTPSTDRQRNQWSAA